MELEYFVATILLDGIKLYLNKGGIWGGFSLCDTVLAQSMKALNFHYYKWYKCYIEEDNEVTAERVKIAISFKAMT